MTQTMRDAVAVVAAALVALAVVVALGALGVAAAGSLGRSGDPAVRPAPMRMVPDRGVRPVPGLPAPAPQKAPVAP